ncbi:MULTISPECIES: hypothetical protein [unclassified Roseovarius]|uniref:hypothetical protein n=1 Tax=unclassified Roseovarius TaxID=2614913 RepID=UPI00273F6B1F|nr:MULTISPECIES: hypothetical protein [unclassified Roseovarius]
MGTTLDSLKSRLLGLDGRLLEDELYKIPWEEIEVGQLDSAAQARSIADGEGDDGKTRSAYIRHRVRRLRDEVEILQAQAKAKAKIASSGPPKDPKERYKWANRLPPYDD